MAEIGVELLPNEQIEIDSLKETVFAQQKLLQKLYNELEVERESSAIAASEALSMILRLQGEKGVVKMEAEQYKRLTKEKMCHAEESLSVFEDLIYQREMEVAALDYQVQAYRYKLLSMGCVDPTIGEIKFPENLLQRNESVHSLGRRNSAPIVPLKYTYQKKIIVERENSTSPESDLMISKIFTGKEETDGSSFVSIWEQIGKLDDRVKEIAGPKYANLQTETSSATPFVSRISSRNSLETTRVDSMNNVMEQVQHPGASSFGNEIYNSNATCVPGVLDVFEVPRADLQPKDEEKMILPSDNMLDKPNFVPQEALEPQVKNETFRLKKLPKSSGGNNLHRSNDNGLAIVYRTTSISSEYRAKFHELSRASEMVEVEAKSSGRGEELKKLLNEIKLQLNAIQSQISSLKTKRFPPRDDQALISLKEEMLHFWL